MLDEALQALQSDIDIAIYDASNINQQRRRLLKDSVAASGLHAKASATGEGPGGGRERRGGCCWPRNPPSTTSSTGCDAIPSKWVCM